MDQVELDGKTYVKAAVVAKDFKYTTDYVGQLCRAKKVDAKLVGRAWFVNPDSIVKHRDGKYSKDEPTKVSIKTNEDTPTIIKVELNSDTGSKVKPSRKVVEPTLKNKTFKTIFQEVPQREHSDHRKLKVAYQADEEVLYPNINKKRTPKHRSLTVEHADGKKVKIKRDKNSRKRTLFKADELPSFVLSGRLSVADIEEEVLETTENKASSPESNDKKRTVKVIETKGSRKAKVKILLPDKQSEPATEPIAASNAVPKEKVLPVKVSAVGEGSEAVTVVTSEVEQETQSTSSFENRLAQKLAGVPSANELRFSPDSVGQMQPVKIHAAVLFSPIISTVLALLVVASIFSTSSSVIATQNEYNANLVLQVANLLEILKNH